MVEVLAEKVKAWLKRLDESIEETDKHYDRLERGGKYDPGMPYMLKYEVWFALDYLKGKGVDVEASEQEYWRISGKLREFEDKRGQEYRVRLCAELLMDVDSYPSTDRLFELTPIDVEAWNDMDQRDHIEVLLMELGRDFDLKAIEKRIQTLDKSFRQKYKEKITDYQSHYASIERSFYPERFWWRHPSAVMAGKDASP